MIDRLSDTRKPCTYCTEYGHTQWKCPRKPRKTLTTTTTLRTTKPMNRGTSTLKTTTTLKPFGQQAKKTAAAVAKWKREYKGVKACHYCQAPLLSGFYAEHMESKARRPDLRTDPTNFVPTCGPCNERKGSKSHDEIPHFCNLVK